jgi:CheY-like chemotaxis protein
MTPSRGWRTPIEADIEDPGASSSLVVLDRVLDGILTVLHECTPERIDATARTYVEDATAAAMAAAVRARDNRIASRAAIPIAEATAVARALLAELRHTRVQAASLVNRSLELRRQAIRVTATALASQRQARRSGVTGRDGLHGIRVLVVGNTPGLVEKFTMLLSALGADVHAVSALGEAVHEAHLFDPDVLLCELPGDDVRIQVLVDDLHGQGLGLPAVAMTGMADAASREAARRAGFTDVLTGVVTFSELSEAIRRTVGR